MRACKLCDKGKSVIREEGIKGEEELLVRD